jgi:ribosomal-protein-alanine N-acetyltransferase
MLFRNATIEDLNAIWEIEKSVFSSPWNRNQLAFELAEYPTASHWVYVKNKSMVGYIMSHVVFPEVQIINIAVSLSYQCRGFGKRLLSCFFSEFDEEVYFYLEVRESNLPALILYTHFGFESIDIRKKYYYDGENAIVMAKAGNSIPQNITNQLFSIGGEHGMV